MTVTLRANNVGGSYTVHEAEQIADYLLATGRAIHPEKWVAGLARQKRQAGNAAVLAGL